MYSDFRGNKNPRSKRMSFSWAQPNGGFANRPEKRIPQQVPSELINPIYAAMINSHKVESPSSHLLIGAVAPEVERSPEEARVGGSNPSRTTK